MKGPIQSVEIAYLVQATEDEEKLEEAVRGFFNTGAAAVKERLEGHYGNEIVRVTIHATGEEAAGVFRRLVSSMPDSVKREVGRDIEEYVDEHSALYIRLDKQLLVSGKVGLSSSDPVRVRVKPRLHVVKGGALALYRREMGLG